MSYNQVAHYYDFEVSEFVDGSNEEIQFAADASGYVKPGLYYLSVTGRGSYQAVNLTATVNTAAPTPPTQEQDDLAPVMLQSGQAQHLTVHQQRYAAVYVPEGVSEVRIWLSDLTPSDSQGNVNLYASREHWPTPEQHQFASRYAGSNQYLAIPVEQAGYLHFSLNAPQQGDDVEMVVYFH